FAKCRGFWGDCGRLSVSGSRWIPPGLDERLALVSVPGVPASHGAPMDLRRACACSRPALPPPRCSRPPPLSKNSPRWSRFALSLQAVGEARNRQGAKSCEIQKIYSIGRRECQVIFYECPLLRLGSKPPFWEAVPSPLQDYPDGFTRNPGILRI